MCKTAVNCNGFLKVWEIIKKLLVKFEKMCNNTNIIYKNNKKEEYIYTVFKEKRSQRL